jgi:hypothetical protein
MVTDPNRTTHVTRKGTILRPKMLLPKTDSANVVVRVSSVWFMITNRRYLSRISCYVYDDRETGVKGMLLMVSERLNRRN